MINKLTPINKDYESCKQCFVDFVVAIEKNNISNDVIQLIPFDYSENETNEVMNYIISSKDNIISKDLRCHLDYLLEKLNILKEKIIELKARGAECYIRCNWYSYGHNGPVLWPSQMQLIANLELDCYFYFVANNDIPSQKIFISSKIYNEDYHAELLIYPEQIHPDEISGFLKLQPTTKNIAGTKVITPRNIERTIKISSWFLSSEDFIQSTKLSDHLNWLLDKLQGSAKELCILQKEDVEMALKCTWYTSQCISSEILYSKQMKVMADLDLECYFDIYFDNHLID